MVTPAVRTPQIGVGASLSRLGQPPSVGVPGGPSRRCPATSTHRAAQRAPSHPEQPICLSQSWSRTVPLEDRELLAEGRVFEGHFSNTAGQNEKANQRA